MYHNISIQWLHEPLLTKTAIAIIIHTQRSLYPTTTDAIITVYRTSATCYNCKRSILRAKHAQHPGLNNATSRNIRDILHTQRERYPERVEHEANDIPDYGSIVNKISKPTERWNYSEYVELKVTPEKDGIC